MIRIEVAHLHDAKALADSMLREEGLKVAVYRQLKGRDGFLVLDSIGCWVEKRLFGALEPRKVYNPERRKSSRADLRIPVQVRVVDGERHGHA